MDKRVEEANSLNFSFQKIEADFDSVRDTLNSKLSTNVLRLCNSSCRLCPTTFRGCGLRCSMSKLSWLLRRRWSSCPTPFRGRKKRGRYRRLQHPVPSGTSQFAPPARSPQLPNGTAGSPQVNAQHNGSNGAIQAPATQAQLQGLQMQLDPRRSRAATPEAALRQLANRSPCASHGRPDESDVS